jgi:hypothetical protein
MNKAAKKTFAKIMSIAEEFGLEYGGMKAKGKHGKHIFVNPKNGESKFLLMHNTASDGRAEKNAIAFAKRMFAEMAN